MTLLFNTLKSKTDNLKYKTNILRYRNEDSFVSYVSTDESTDESAKEGNKTEEAFESLRMFPV